MKIFYVYIMTNRQNGQLFISVASKLKQRVHEHREGLIEGFTKKHNIKLLVWYAPAADEKAAIARAEQIKQWSDGWQRKLIEEKNKEWRDLYEELEG